MLKQGHMETKEETDQKIKEYFDENKKRLSGFFIRKTGDKDEGEGLFGEFLKKFTLAIYKKPRPKGDYPKLETVIKKAVLNDYYRKDIRKKKGQYELNSEGSYDWIEPEKKKGQKQKDVSVEIILKEKKNKELGEIKDKLDKKLQGLLNDEEPEEKKKPDTGHREWQFKKALLNEIKPIQEVAIISLAKNLGELKLKITEKKFPYVAERFKEKGYKYEIFLKKGKKFKEFSKIYKREEEKEFVYENEKEPSEQQLDNMNLDFNLLLNKIADGFEINETIGIDALKILLLSENFWRDLGRLSQKNVSSAHKKDNKDSNATKITKKEAFNLFRNFYLYEGGLIKLNKFLERKRKDLDEKLKENDETIEGAREKVSIEDIKKLFKIEFLNSNVSKEERRKLREKIEKYEQLINEIMEWKEMK